MPMYIEYDKITRQVRRVLSADDLPPDAAHLSYVEIPIDTPEIDLTSDIDAIRKVIDGRREIRTSVVTPTAKVPEPPPLIEEV